MKRAVRRSDGRTGGQAVRRTVGRVGSLLLLLSALVPINAGAQSTAIINATVHQDEAPALEGATVLMEAGRISAVGADVTIPEGTRRIDAAGRLVTPGFIHSITGLGLTEVGAVSGTREGSKAGAVTPSFNVFEGINPASTRIPPTRVGGVTTVLTLPGGGLLRGQGVAIDLDGITIEQMVVRSPAVMVMDLGSSSKGAGGGSRAGVMALLRQLFNDAEVLRAREVDYEERDMRDLAAPAEELAALWPVLDGEIPLAVWANRVSDMENALRLADEYDLDLIILGGAEAWKIADKLAERFIPVVVNPFANIPSFDGLAVRYDNASLLHEAGVPVLLYESDAGGPRNLRFAAGMAVRNGFPRHEAFRAITTGPARAFGLEDYGSIEVGKVANVVVWDGDPFDFSGAPAHVFIRGTEQSMESRQKELLERYRTLPPEY